MFNQKSLNAIAQEVKNQGLSAMLIAPSNDLAFVLGHSPSLCERFQGLFILPNGDYFYICNLLTADEMTEYLPNRRVYSWFDGDGFIETTKKAFEENGLMGGVIGVSLGVRAFNILELAEELDITFKSARLLPFESRIIKTEEELEGLRQVANITDRAFLQLLPQIKLGQTEQDVKDILFAEMEKLGGSKCWAIVASGPNGSYPHYHLSSRVLQRGDGIVIDFGCVLNGLCSDCTRTIFLGEASQEQQKIYNIVLQANLAGEAAAVNGAFIPDIDKAARTVIQDAGYGKYFSTRLGHGIGCSIHEAPDIKQTNKRNLAPGMAFSIEPGIYIAGNIGVRIEDIVIINSSGQPEVLNKTSKELIILEV